MKTKSHRSKEQEICYQCPICPYCYDDHNNFDRCKESFENGIKKGRKDAIEEVINKVKDLFKKTPICSDRELYNHLDKIKKEMIEK